MSNKGAVPKEQAAAIARKAANMAVQQAGQQPKSKPKRGKKAGGRKQPRGGGANGAVAAHVNPFLPGVRVRWPDEDAVPSVAFRSRTIFNLSRVANTGGSAGGQYFAVRFVADPGACYNQAPTLSGSAPNLTWPITTWPAGGDKKPAEYNSLALSFTRYRIVNWGVRVKGVGQVLTNQGSLYALTIADAPSLSYPASPYVSTMRKTVVQLNGTGPDFVWISKPLDNRAREYQDIGVVADSAWESLYLYSDDNAGSSPLMIELVFNFELIPRAGDFAERLAQKAAPSDPGMMSKIMNTFQSMSNVILNNDTVQNAVSHVANQAVSFAAAEASRRIAAASAPRAGSRQSYYIEEVGN